MAFISACPKCQKSVLVPDGHGHDAVVQCPACFAEYPLGDILAAAPPALIVVQPSSAALSVTTAAAAPALEGSLFSAHRIEPSLHDSPLHDGETLLFSEEHAPMATPPGLGHSDDQIPLVAAGEEAGLATIAGDDFAVGMEEPVKDEFAPFAEPPMAHVEGEATTEVPAEATEAAESWGDNWGSFGDEPVPVEGEEGIGVAEAEEGMDGVDFAAITGKAAPGMGAVGADAGGEVASIVTAEPPKKKRRKREANMLVRGLGIVIFGLLALPCSLLLAKYVFHQQLDFPEWVPSIFRTAKTQPPAKPPATSTTPAPSSPASNAPAPGANQPGASTATISTSATIAEGDKGLPNNGAANTNPSPTPETPKTNPSAPGGNEIAMTDKPRPKGNAGGSEESPQPTEPANPLDSAPKPLEPDKNDLAPPPAVAPIGDKPKSADSGDPFAGTEPAAPKSETPKTEVKPAMPATKPDTSKPDGGDPFSSPEPTAPKVEKPKTETKPEPSKPESGDPFSAPESTAPKADKPKTEVKPDNSKPQATAPDSGDPFSAPEPKVEKPKTETKPEMPAPVKPDTSKPETGDPFSAPEPTAPKSETPKTETKPETTKPQTLPPEIEKPALVPPTVKPEPVKPEVKPEPIKPEPAKPEVKPGVGPLNAESFAATDLDAAMKAAPAGGNLDAAAYAAWCKLADVATFAGGETPAQKQAVQALVSKVSANPQAAAAIAAGAKKLLDEKATKGGIVLAGKVSGSGERKGIFGTAIRMDGLDKPVMVFSSHALGVAQGQAVVVLGALVNEPSKNLPGYSGKQPVIVWAEFAQPTP